MNRVYRLVWNRSLNALQAAPENARTAGGSAGGPTSRALRRNPFALAVATLVLATSAPAWSQSCTPTSPSGCAATGGQGTRQTRNNNGGSGNGTGGGASFFNPDSTEAVGSAASNGNGGAGADGFYNAQGNNLTSTGGSGGLVGATGSAGVNASVTGGTGGTGQAAPANSFVGGGGGGGGAGVFINDANSLPTVAAGTTITGGQGGVGGYANTGFTPGGSSGADPGGGGGGGAGVIIGAGAGAVSLTNNGRIGGGAGGAGGSGGYAGSGGAGGDGLLVLGAGASITNGAGGRITGGAGGAPGTLFNADAQAGGYGGGGAGVNLVGAGSSLNNAGAIVGGAGGYVGPGTVTQLTGAPGVGVRGWGGAGVTTTGSIQGGTNSSGLQGDSVLFSGGGNQLTIDPGAIFTGNIESQSGTTNGGDTLILSGSGTGTLNSGLIVGFANNIKNGASTWALTGTGNAGINWTVQQGQLIGSDTAFDGNLTFASNGIGTPSAEFNQGASGIYAGTISGQGQLIETGAGTLSLSGNLSGFTGQFAINQGSVALTGSGDMHGAEVSTTSSGLDVSGISGTSATLAGISGSGTVTLGTRTLVLDNPAADTYSGVISGTGAVTLQSGTETFTGANTYSGDTTINAGTLTLTGAGTIGSGQSRLALNAGTLDASGLTAGSTLGIRSLAGGGSLTLGANNLAIATGADTFSGVISGSGGVTLNGGTETFSGVNTYSGGTTVNAGTLKLTGGGQIGQGQSRVALNGGALDASGLTAGSTLAIRSLAGGGGVTLGASNLSIATAADTFSGAISGTGGVALQVGMETFTGVNTYSGDTSINNASTLALTGAGAIGQGQSRVALTGTLDVSGLTAGSTLAIRSLAGSGGVTLGANNLSIATGADTFSGVISGSGGVALNGGTETLSGVNTYSGDTTINAGTLALTGAGAIGQGQSRVALNGGTLDASGLTAGSTLDIRSLAGSSGVTLGANNLAIETGADSYSGVIGGTGGVTLQSGTETFSGVNTYTGDTSINNASTLALTGGGQIGQGQSRVALTGTLNVSGLTAGSTLDIRSLAGSGGVTLGANTLAIATGADTFSGVIGGTGGFTVNGGTETLTGNNTYTGTTAIGGGTLAFSGGGQINGSSVQMTSGTLDVSGKTAGSSLNIVSLAGGGGNVTLGNVGIALSSATGTYDGVIAGAGTVGINAGSEVFNGANTYSGLTSIASGATLLVGDSTHATAQVGGDVAVNGGTLGGYGTVRGSATVSNGGTLVPGAAGAIGTLTVNGDLVVGANSKLNFDFGAPGANFSTFGQSDHVVVNGNLSVDTSTLNVNNLGSMGPGLYNLFDWGGSLSIVGGGFAPPSGMSLQILTTDKQINLIDTLGLTLNEWDANGQASASAMGGGSGTWSASSNVWANTNGTVVGPMSPQPSFAIFGGAAGTVTVDDSSGAVSTTGMQFISDGYHLTGDALTLVGQGGVAPVVRVSSGATATVDNVLNGTSGLNKTDAGTLVLTGSNLYQGNTTLSGGLLSVASEANLGSSANALDFEGGALKITGTGFTQTTRNIIWGSAGGGFDIDDAANTFTVTQALTGTGGLLKSGAGMLLLNGSNTYSGATMVNGGTLEVGDVDHSSASVGGDVQVNATGTLRGHGTVVGNIANNGGTVTPGGSIGMLNVGGNYTQASNGVLAVEVSPTAASLLNVTGSATLNGVLAITYDPGTYTAKQYTLVSAGQGINGRFSSVTGAMSSGAVLGSLQQGVTYSGNQVGLTLANAAVGPTNPVTPVTPVTPVVIAPTGISIYTALGSSVSIGAQAANTALLARLNHLSDATAGAPDGWIDATGAQTHVGGTSGEPGYQANRYGFLAGLDNKLGDYTVGIAAGYTHTDVDEQQTGDSGTADTLRVALYGSRWFGPVGVSATAGYALDFLSQKRPFGALGTAEGDHIGNEFTAGGQASLPMTFGSIVVTPSAGLRYAYFRANGFTESGAGGQDLGVGTDNVRSLQPYAEVTVDKAFGDALRPIDLQVRLGYAQELLHTNRAVSVTAQDGTLFAAPGTSLPRGYLTAGVSLSMQPTKAMTVSVGYDTLINTTHASAQAASLKLGYRF